MKFRTFFLVTIFSLIAFRADCQATTDDLVTTCVLSSGEDATYLKDFRIQLPQAAPNGDAPAYKANMYLMKNVKYRFTICNAPDSQGEMEVTIFDQGKEMISSYIKSTGKIYSSVDFICNKTGLYTIWYRFIDGRQGSGVGVVSMIR